MNLTPFPVRPRQFSSEVRPRSPQHVAKQDLTLDFPAGSIRFFSADERRIAEGVLDSLIVQHQAKRLFAQPASASANTAPKATAPSKSSGKRRAAR
ncbi:hypothetical protein [Aquimonas voraii]|uniref:hypothetical protein n=1 Tax=Aquimonas voraii TaxID=265719 RepID=UPI00115FDDA5|nr:hypothetical protein [Aquimonas voraii]